MKMLKPVHLSEGARILSRSLFVRKQGTFRYEGDAEQICRRIISDCWNKKKNYFQTSNGHFSQFYTRDFAFCAEALMNLGFEDKVRLTLEYALKAFSRSGRVTTSITPGGKPFDFPCYASDSLPLLIRALKSAGCTDLFHEYSTLFVNEVNRYHNQVFDPETAMVKKNRQFSSMKDWAKRNSSCYDNSMLAMLREDLNELKFYNPFQEHDIKKRFKEELWNGKYFYEDMDKKDIVAGDANVFPFWTGVYSTRDMAKSCIKSMQKAKLDRPFPLKYTNSRRGQRFMFLERLVGNYEGTAVWPHLGLCFIDVLMKYSKKEARRCVEQYTQLIEKNSNFLEVFDEDGRPFSRRFYHADEGMLWACKYLDFLRK
ncbi:MAG: hypothetical protein R6U32_06595 [Candidatus Woesearchaeota archaeon]